MLIFNYIYDISDIYIIYIYHNCSQIMSDFGDNDTHHVGSAADDSEIVRRDPLAEIPFCKGDLILSSSQKVAEFVRPGWEVLR